MHLPHLLANGLLASTIPHVLSHATTRREKLRTVVTTDMESDDLASLVRYILYANDLDNQGLIYTSSKFHWEGDGKGTEFFLPDREYNTSQTSWRPTGTTTIEKYLLKAYAEVYSNLKVHDSEYPTPEHLLSLVRVGNVDFDSEMSHDTPGSDLIASLLLDNDPRPLYLQAWGGTNTIARALLSLSTTYSSSPSWPALKAHISRKAVILASGFQDNTYTSYIAPHWPALRVLDFSAAYATWGFNCNTNHTGNVRGLPDNNEFYQGSWIKANIQTGPLGSLYRSWLDNQTTPGGGDQLDVFGDAVKAPGGWCKPLGKYDFLSEGDNVVFNPLLPTGLERPGDPTVGSWGGRSVRNTSVPQDLWTLIANETAANGSLVQGWTTGRWVEAASNDFAARMKWTLTGEYAEGNHPPVVQVVGGTMRQVSLGGSVRLAAEVSDPDGDKVEVKWWQYKEEGTYEGIVRIEEDGEGCVVISVSGDAEKGQTVSMVLQGRDSGEFPLTRYGRVMISVV